MIYQNNGSTPIISKSGAKTSADSLKVYQNSMKNMRAPIAKAPNNFTQPDLFNPASGEGQFQKKGHVASKSL